MGVRMRAEKNVILIAVVVILLSSAAQLQARVLYRARRPRIPQRLWSILGRDTDVMSVAGLDYYVQLGLGGPDLQDLLPAINSTASSFGQTQLFTLNVTQEQDPSSTLLGTVRGYTVQSSYTGDSVGVEVEVLIYDDGTLSGTVSIQGVVQSSGTEVAVVGGTGDFRGVKGYGVVTFANATATNFIFHHQLYFL
ncbi:hypothetical protein KP509_09G046000 [Ceratopteris richardii]|uniref:Dirigent protein n=1 Tax=Ceratopteris richardii TaxID=49495 RepID=A0A8T2TZY4_CERRI|nr:hypothetical protein KP509_09G046000 [Ceratopteris richardii]